MARHSRSSKFETRTSRLRLPVAKKPTFVVLAPGIALGYRRNHGPGTWVVRSSDGHGRQWTKGFAIADDFEEADGEHVQTFFQAQDNARALARGKDAAASSRPVTVAEAIDDYEKDLVARGGDIGNVLRARHHLTSILKSKPVSLLAAKELRHWRDSLGGKASSINRTLAAVKAALNLAADHDPRIGNRETWRIALKSLPDAYVARNAVLPDEAVRTLIAAAWEFDPALGLLVETAAVTGARASQMFRLEVADLQDANGSSRLMMPSSRKGRSRKKIDRLPVPIPASLAAKLRQAAGERGGAAPLLLKSNGTRWTGHEHSHPFAKAAAKAALAGTTIYALRHSSITRSLIANVPVRIVAANHDTSVVMIERTYSRYIGDHSEAIARRALLDLGAVP
jgi:integrase